MVKSPTSASPFVVRARFACGALFTLAISGSGVARAADPRVQQDLEQAEQALVNLDYDGANKVAARLVQQHGLTHEQLVRSYRVLALTDAVLDKESAAREAFQQLLAYDPSYQGDANLGPKVQAPFMEARGFLRAQAVQPGIDVAVVLRASEPGTIRVTTRDPTHVAKRAAVSYRWGGDGAYTTAPVAIAEGATTDVPPPPTGTTRLDYYVQVFDDRDNAAFESGNAMVPKSATVDMSTAIVAFTGSSRTGEEETRRRPPLRVRQPVVLGHHRRRPRRRGNRHRDLRRDERKGDTTDGRRRRAGRSPPEHGRGSLLAPVLQCRHDGAADTEARAGRARRVRERKR